MRIEVFVPGVPAAQGSKDQFGRESSRHVKPWRATVAACALQSALDAPLSGAVAVFADFIFPRPKKHFRGGRHADELRDDAPFWHVGKPDLDKLQRAIGDAMVGVLLRDDAQVARWMTRKHYGSRPGALIAITPLGVADDDLLVGVGDEELVA